VIFVKNKPRLSHACLGFRRDLGLNKPKDIDNKDKKLRHIAVNVESENASAPAPKTKKQNPPNLTPSENFDDIKARMIKVQRVTV